MKKILTSFILLLALLKTDAQSNNTIRIGYGTTYYFNNSILMFRDNHPIAFIIPNLQYQRQLKYYPNYGIVLQFGFYQYNNSKYISETGVTSGNMMLYGIGLTHQKLINKFKYNFGGGLTIRKGGISNREFDPKFGFIFEYSKNINGYGLFAQTELDYKLYKFINIFSQLRYHLFFKNYNNAVSLDLGLGFSF